MSKIRTLFLIAFSVLFGLDSTADVKISELPAHTTLIDADSVPIVDSTAHATKQATWSTIKSVLKTYFDGEYDASGDAVLVKSDLAHSLSTGLISGGQLTINSDATKFNIAAGTGIVVDNHSTPGVTTITNASWGNLEVSATIGAGSRHPVYIAIDEDDTVYQQTSRYAATDLPSRIVLGVISVNPATGYVVATYDIAYTAYEPDVRFSQFLDAIGTFNVSGNVYSANGANLYLNRSAGVMYRQGANYGTDRRAPDLCTSDAATQESFFYVKHVASAWSYGPAPTTSIDPEYYDNQTQLTAMPTGKWKIDVMFYNKDVKFLQYGQRYYDTSNDAIAGISDAITTHPMLLPAEFVARSFIITQQGCTTLNSSCAIFREAGKFGLGSTAGGSSGGGEANTASNAGTAGTGLFYQKSGVDLQFKALKSSTGKVTVTDTVSDHTVDLGVSISTSDVSGLGTAATHASTDFDAAGAASTVAGNLSTHTGLTTTAHGGIVPSTRKITSSIDLSADRNLTYSDVGADASGAASTVAGNLSTHAGLTTTAHGGIVASNTAITGGTKTKVTYDTKGLITSGADATTADIADSTNKRYVTDAQLTVIGNTSGTNSGNQSDATLTFTDITTNNASTTAHGFLNKAVAPAANLLNVPAITNGETVYSNKTILGSTTPSTQAYGDSASAGTSLEAAHADHKHTFPAVVTDATLSFTDVTTGNASTTSHGYAPKVVAPGTGSVSFLGVASGETVRSEKVLIDNTTPSTQAYGDSAAVGSNNACSHADHKHAMPATTKDTTAATGILEGNGSTVSAATDATDYFSSVQSFPNANLTNGISNGSTALQSQTVVSGTAYYITNSALTMPASSKTNGGMSTSTRMNWHVFLGKDAAGTGSFQIVIYRGVNGTTSDTADVSQSIGTQTAVIDTAWVDVTLTVTTTGSSGAYFWTISALHATSTGTGFGVVSTAVQYWTGTKSTVAMNTASLKFGLGFISTTGTPAIKAFCKDAHAWNMN
jgi:hypothetical protein